MVGLRKRKSTLQVAGEVGVVGGSEVSPAFQSLGLKSISSSAYRFVLVCIRRGESVDLVFQPLY
jgi:hypothetical protein